MGDPEPPGPGDTTAVALAAVGMWSHSQASSSPGEVKIAGGGRNWHWLTGDSGDRQGFPLRAGGAK